MPSSRARPASRSISRLTSRVLGVHRDRRDCWRLCAFGHRAGAGRVSRVDLVSVLKGFGGPIGGTGAPRSAFLVAQVSMSVLLLVTAGLFILDVPERAIPGARCSTAAHVHDRVDSISRHAATPQARGRALVRDAWSSVSRRRPASPRRTSSTSCRSRCRTASGIVLRDGDAERRRRGRTPVAADGLPERASVPDISRRSRFALVAGRDFTYHDDRDRAAGRHRQRNAGPPLLARAGCASASACICVPWAAD